MIEPIPNEPVERTCRDCGQVFVVSDRELEFFRDMARQYPQGDGRGWQLPARCLPCRRWRRAVAAGA